MTVNSLVSLPQALTESASHISRFALVVAIAAIGMKSNLAQIAKVGIKPVILLVSETLWIAGVILTGIFFWVG